MRKECDDTAQQTRREEAQCLEAEDVRGQICRSNIAWQVVREEEDQTNQTYPFCPPLSILTKAQ